MRTFNKSRAAQESAEAKDLQAKRAAHTAFGRLEFNRNFWAKRRKTATATGGSAPAESNVEAELELEDETAADAAAVQTAGESGDGGSNHERSGGLPQHGGEGDAYEEAMVMKRRGDEVLVAFGKWLSGDQQSRNTPSRRAAWLRVLSAFIYSVGAPAPGQQGRVWVSLRELNTQVTQTRYLNSVPGGSRRELVTVWELLKQFGETFQLETPDVCLQNMKKTAAHHTKTASNLRYQQGKKMSKEPKISTSLLREKVLTGVAGLMREHKSRLSTLVRGGKSKKSLATDERKLLAATPVAVINFASKPERSCVLAAMTTAEVTAWIDGGANLIRKQEKLSVKNPFVVLPCNPVVKQGLAYYLEFIRPVLAMGGKGASHLDCKKAGFILEADVERAHEHITMAPDEWCQFLIKEGVIVGGGRRTPSRWAMIFERCGPWSWDPALIKRTKRKVDYGSPPTLSQLRIAVNTRFNESFLLDASGDSMERCGDSLALICSKYAGVPMKITMLRKLVTTEAKGQGKPMAIVDEALEHTAAISEKHYQLKDMDAVGDEWAEIYQAGVDMSDLGKQFTSVTNAPCLAPRNKKGQ